MVRGQAVDEQRAHTESFELPGRASEEVTFRAAPVLPVDATHPVAAATEAEPDGQAGLQHDLHCRHGEVVAEQRHRFHENQVGRILRQDPEQQAQRIELLGMGDITIEREGDGAAVALASLLDGLAGQPHAEARHVHPMGPEGRAGDTVRFSLRRVKDRPRIRRDEVATGGDKRAVDLQDRVGRIVEAPRAPEALVVELVALEVRSLQFGGHTAVKDDAGVIGQQMLNPPVGRRFLLARE